MQTDSGQLPAHLLPAPEWPSGRWWNAGGYRSAATRLKVAYVFLAGEAVLTVAIGAYYLLTPDPVLTTGLVPVINELPPFDPVLLVLILVDVGIAIGTAIAVLAWLSRSVDNCWYLLGGTPEWSPGWSIGWWFIPGANFVMPFLVVRDLNRRMARGMAAPGTALVLVWWISGFVLAAVSILAGAIIGGLAVVEPQSIEEYARLLATLSGAFALLGLIPIVLGVVVFTRIQRHADMRAPYAIPPPPPYPPVPPGGVPWYPPAPSYPPR